MIIDGRKISEKILSELKKEINERQLKLKLAVVLVGDDPQSQIYVKKKGEACRDIGIEFELYEFPSEIKEEELLKEVEKISQDASGVVVQLPLPKEINTDRVLNTVAKEKDVEGFISEKTSPIVCAIKHVLKEYEISLENQKIALVGRGRLVGGPVGKWLEEQGLSFSDNTKEADLIISGVGKRNLIIPDQVKENVIIIDVGGDVSPEIENKASLFTPIVGGVGPITVACLLKNLVEYGSKNI